MKKDKALQVAYASGLFDGEGCIVCLRRTDTHGHHYRVALQVWMSSYEWVDHLVGLFGGKVRCSYGGTKKPGWIWDLQGLGKVKSTLKTMLPFLKVKRIEAELALRLIDRMIVAQRKNQAGHHQIGLTDHEIKQRQKLLDAIKLRKNVQFGIPKCIPKEGKQYIRAAVETNYSDKVKSKTLKS